MSWNLLNTPRIYIYIYIYFFVGYDTNCTGKMLLLNDITILTKMNFSVTHVKKCADKILIFSTNSLGKSMNPIILPPAMGK